jgi:hypothetical protein
MNRFENNIEMEVTQSDFEVVNKIQLAQRRLKWRNLLRTSKVIKFLFP